MKQFSLEGKTILVTGASSGIGKQVAISVAAAGAKVCITGRNRERLEECFNTLQGGGHHLHVADLIDEDAVNLLVDELDKLDGVVFSAGITTHKPAKFIRGKDFNQIFDVNFRAPVLLTGRLLKKKKINENSSFVFMSSIASEKAYFGGALYSSTKSAIETYSRTLALELAPKKIRSNCLLPTFVKTPMVEGAGETISQEVLDRFEKMSPLGFGEPEDVANAAIFLLSDAAKWITGINIPLGGF
ncbi:MAG: SDR family oxidoreductase [Bacteroidota bacterium]|nr:SDR family oxidoreductase [Bacteroidota bacterium]